MPAAAPHLNCPWCTYSKMRMCPQCQSIQQKTTKGNEIVFVCRQCGWSVPGTDDDTLMSEQYYESDQQHITMHQAFIEQAAYDPAGNIVLETCPDCGVDFMTMVRIGESAITIYTCRCGYQATREDFLKTKK